MPDAGFSGPSEIGLRFLSEVKLKQIWYACYGSNLRAERFNCYIVGGKPAGSVGMESAGSIDKTPPTSTTTFKTDWQLYFAKEFVGWGGKGVAFLKPGETDACSTTAQDSNKPGALCRLYKISFEQFVDVVLQENGGRSSHSQLRASVKNEVVQAMQSIGTKGTTVLRQGVLDGSWYRRMVRLGTHEDLPVLTFTSDEQLSFVPPGEAYLRTIALGLLESWHGKLSKAELIDYLARSARWPQEDVVGLIS